MSEKSFYSTMDHINDQKETLFNAWIYKSREEFETTLRMAIQDVEAEKVSNPSLNVSMEYLLGKIDGYTEAFEQLYRFESSLDNPSIIAILQMLNSNERVRADDLLSMYGSRFSVFPIILRNLVNEGIIEKDQSIVCFYKITDQGRRLLIKKLSESNGGNHVTV